MKQSSLKILVVEDDDLHRHNLAKQLSNQGHEIQQAASKAQALDKISNGQFDLSFVDLDLDERRAGFDLIPLLKKKGVYSVILSGHREEAYVEEGYGKECDDYLTKPFKATAVDEILLNYRGSSQKTRLRKLIAQKMITQDPDHLQQFDILVESMGIKKLPILITGPSGVGKSVLAEILHEGWHGHKDRFVEINANSLSDTLLQSELLGHVDGAFTGAHKKRIGKIAQADQGTLFIDEIGTIGTRMQHTLLVPLANGHFSPVGSNERLYSDFKLITATCEELHEKISAKQFREDFFNRISGVTVKFKPLKERRQDIELLLNHVQKNFGEGRGMAIRPSAKKALLEYDWPGNEREFFEFWKSKAKTKKPVFSVEDLPHKIATNSYPGKHAYNLLTERQIKYVEEVGLKAFLAELEKEVADHFRRKLGKDRPIRPLMRHLGYSQKKVTSLLDELKEAEL
ncbi:MAG: sigma-54-dependent transcriptional regulator [Bacteriovoracia bacterium]